MIKLLQVYGCKIMAISDTMPCHQDENMDIFRAIKIIICLIISKLVRFSIIN